jgi:hypothetical protein
MLVVTLVVAVSQAGATTPSPFDPPVTAAGAASTMAGGSVSSLGATPTGDCGLVGSPAVGPTLWPQTAFGTAGLWRRANCGASGITVGLIGGPVDQHPQLAGRVSEVPVPHAFSWPVGFGTFATKVAGAVGAAPTSHAVGPGDPGFEGLAPRARLLWARLDPTFVTPQLETRSPVPTDGHSEDGQYAISSADAALALDALRRRGADVVVIETLVRDGQAAVLRSAVTRALRAGVVVVLAAPERDLALKEDPAPSDAGLALGGFDGVIVVGAVGSPKSGGDRRWLRSPDLPEVELLAPGAGLVSTAYPTTSSPAWWASGAGTGIAAGYVAGAAALLLAAHRGLSPAQVEDLLRTTADPYRGGVAGFGSGILAPAAALDAAAALQTPGAMVSPVAVPSVRTARGGPSGVVLAVVGGMLLAAVLVAAASAAIPRGQRGRWRPRLAAPPEPQRQPGVPPDDLFDRGAAGRS